MSLLIIIYIHHNLFLYSLGMMGCGKSTIGNIFANKLGYRFLDTDEIAEYMIEMPITEFFQQGNDNKYQYNL